MRFLHIQVFFSHALFSVWLVLRVRKGTNCICARFYTNGFPYSAPFAPILQDVWCRKLWLTWTVHLTKTLLLMGTAGLYCKSNTKNVRPVSLIKRKRKNNYCSSKLPLIHLPELISWKRFWKKVSREVMIYTMWKKYLSWWLYFM